MDSWGKRGMHPEGNIMLAGDVEKVLILGRAAGCILRPMVIAGIWKRGVLA